MLPEKRKEMDKMSKRKFCAHRGFNAVAPDNSLPAFAAAVALGADEIDFDLNQFRQCRYKLVMKGLCSICKL